MPNIKPTEVSCNFAIDDGGVKVERIKYVGFNRCTMSQARDAVMALHPGRMAISIAYMRDQNHLWLTLRRNEQ